MAPSPSVRVGNGAQHPRRFLKGAQRPIMHLIFSGLRAAIRAPGFSSLAAVPLAVGFAAAILISSVGVRLYYHSLPVASPERLVVLRSPGPTFGSVEKDTEETVFSFPLY